MKRILFAIFMLLASQFSMGAQLKEQNAAVEVHAVKAQDDQAQTPKDPIKSTPALQAADGPSESKAAPPDTQNEHTKNDKEHKERSVFGFKISNILALIALILTAVFGASGIWLSLLGLGQTRKSNEDQNRAYVHAETAWFGGGSIPKVWLTVSNTGVTPAKWFEIATYSKTLRKVTKDDLNFEKVGPFTRWSALASGGSLKPPTGSANEIINVARAMEDKKLQFLVYGIIRYETIFGETYETQFAFVKATPEPSTDVSVDEGTVFLARPPTNLKVYSPV